MNKFLLLFYVVIVLYVWINAVSEFAFSEGRIWTRTCHAIAKIFFAPVWIICVFSAQGREYLFNWTSKAKL